MKKLYISEHYVKVKLFRSIFIEITLKENWPL